MQNGESSNQEHNEQKAQERKLQKFEGASTKTARMSTEEAHEKTTRIRKGLKDTGRLLYEVHAGKGYTAMGYTTWQKYLDAEVLIGRSYAGELMGAHEFSQTMGKIADPGLSVNAQYAFWRHHKPGKDLSQEDAAKLWRRDYAIARSAYPPPVKITEQIANEVCEQVKIADRLGLSDGDWEVGGLCSLMWIDNWIFQKASEKIRQFLDGNDSTQSLSREIVQQIIADSIEKQTPPPPTRTTASIKNETRSRESAEIHSEPTQPESSDVIVAGKHTKSTGRDNSDAVQDMLSLVEELYDMWLAANNEARLQFKESSVEKAKAKNLFFTLGVKY